MNEKKKMGRPNMAEEKKRKTKSFRLNPETIRLINAHNINGRDIDNMIKGYIEGLELPTPEI